MPSTCLPDDAVAIRAEDAERGTPFLGGVDSGLRVGFFMPKAGRCAWLSLRVLISAAARAAGSSYDEVLDSLRSQPSPSAAPSGPGLSENANGDRQSGLGPNR